MESELDFQQPQQCDLMPLERLWGAIQPNTWDLPHMEYWLENSWGLE